MGRKLISFSCILIASFIVFLFSDSSVLALDIPIRVLIYKGKEFSVSGDTLTLYIRNSEQNRLDGLSRINGRLDGSRLLLEISDKNQESKVLTLEDRSVLEITGNDISVNGTAYRGGLRILNRNNSLLGINILPLEEYLYSVVPSEVPYYWHMEALKVQAVLARTYALKSIMNSVGRDYDIEDNQNSQMYRGKSWEYSTTTTAVNSTKGEVVFYEGSIANVYFHSTCGGHTESAKNVWNIPSVPYLTGVKCPYCGDSPWSSWERVIRREDWDKVIKNSELELEYSPSGRIIRLNGIEGTKIRSIFNLPSTLITGIEVREKEVIVKGKGYGHGVGVCQWGMKKMAELGFSYREIISYYLPGVAIDAYRGF